MESESDSPCLSHSYSRWCRGWKLELRDCGASPLRARAAVECGEMDQGDVREETVVGNACGGKPGSRGSKMILLSQA